MVVEGASVLSNESAIHVLFGEEKCPKSPKCTYFLVEKCPKSVRKVRNTRTFWLAFSRKVGNNGAILKGGEACLGGKVGNFVLVGRHTRAAVGGKAPLLADFLSFFFQLSDPSFKFCVTVAILAQGKETASAIASFLTVRVRFCPPSYF